MSKEFYTGLSIVSVILIVLGFMLSIAPTLYDFQNFFLLILFLQQKAPVFFYGIVVMIIGIIMYCYSEYKRI